MYYFLKLGRKTTNKIFQTNYLSLYLTLKEDKGKDFRRVLHHEAKLFLILFLKKVTSGFGCLGFLSFSPLSTPACVYNYYQFVRIVGHSIILSLLQNVHWTDKILWKQSSKKNNYLSYIFWHLSQTILIVSHNKNYPLHKCNAIGENLNDAIGAQK